jgi:hypothetical protein
VDRRGHTVEADLNHRQPLKHALALVDQSLNLVAIAQNARSKSQRLSGRQKFDCSTINERLTASNMHTFQA